VGAAVAGWAGLVGVRPEAFQRATVKKHRATTFRLNKGDGYRGFLVVEVAKSSRLYRRIEGIMRGTAAEEGSAERVR
jgi:hypothetical protein